MIVTIVLINLGLRNRSKENALNPSRLNGVSI